MAYPSVPLLPVAWGEVFDKLTILQIKAERLHDEKKRAHVQYELEAIENVVGDLTRFPDSLPSLIAELKEINSELWEIEDGKRECERHQCFDDHFVRLARSVYFGNDERAAIKKAINILLGSAIVEEKSYQSYGTVEETWKK